MVLVVRAGSSRSAQSHALDKNDFNISANLTIQNFFTLKAKGESFEHIKSFSSSEYQTPLTPSAASPNAGTRPTRSKIPCNGPLKTRYSATNDLLRALYSGWVTFRISFSSPTLLVLHNIRFAPAGSRQQSYPESCR